MKKIIILSVLLMTTQVEALEAGPKVNSLDTQSIATTDSGYSIRYKQTEKSVFLEPAARAKQNPDPKTNSYLNEGLEFAKSEGGHKLEANPKIREYLKTEEKFVKDLIKISQKMDAMAKKERSFASSSSSSFVPPNVSSSNGKWISSPSYGTGNVQSQSEIQANSLQSKLDELEIIKNEIDLMAEDAPTNLKMLEDKMTEIISQEYESKLDSAVEAEQSNFDKKRIEDLKKSLSNEVMPYFLRLGIHVENVANGLKYAHTMEGMRHSVLSANPAYRYLTSSSYSSSSISVSDEDSGAGGGEGSSEVIGSGSGTDEKSEDGGDVEATGSGSLLSVDSSSSSSSLSGFTSAIVDDEAYMKFLEKLN